MFDALTVTGWLNEMITQLSTTVVSEQPVAMIGVRRGGVDVGLYLFNGLKELGITFDSDMGELNIAFYRDDFSSVGLHPVVGPSHVPFDVTGRQIILVDDVLGTGRTIRAAMNEIFDYGRPARITLAVLVQRTEHELPIRADIVGKNLSVLEEEYIDLDAPNWQLNVGAKA